MCFVLIFHDLGTKYGRLNIFGKRSFQGSKVIHTAKKLFCYVGSICNLVQEFNGLVSIKGPAKVGPFTFKKNHDFSSEFFLHHFFFSRLRILATVIFFHEQNQKSFFLYQLRL